METRNSIHSRIDRDTPLYKKATSSCVDLVPKMQTTREIAGLLGFEADLELEPNRKIDGASSDIRCFPLPADLG